MMATALQHQTFSDTTPVCLPEELHGASAIAAAMVDTASAIAAMTVAALLTHDGQGAVIAALAFLSVATLVGRYRRCFALRGRDELYAAGAVALVAIPLGALLSHALGYGLASPILCGLGWVPLAGIGFAVLQRARRNDRPSIAGVEYVREGRRRTIGMAIERGMIRALDVLLASLASVLLAPVMLVIAIAIVREDGAAPIFRQVRVGRDDHDFVLLKFRTMRVGANTEWARPGDARITPLGARLRRSSLDELPQLWNVLVGEMSLVGPRPEMREYADRFEGERPIYWQRHLVRPGITGWAQLHLPRNVQPSDMPEVLRSDLFAIEYNCMYLYLFCLTKTALEVALHRAV